MSMSDPIADFLTRIRNALAARHANVSMGSSRMKRELARILTEEGYIESFETQTDGPKSTIELKLKYAADGEPVVRGIQRVSSPGCRVYRGARDIPKVLNGPLDVSPSQQSRSIGLHG